MKAIVTVSNFKTIVSRAALPIEHHNTIPVLDMVRLVVADAVLTATGTDLDMVATASCPVMGAEAGGVLVNARRLLRLLRALPENDIHLAVVDNRMLLDVPHGRFVFMCGPIADFPSPDDKAVSATASIEAADLRNLIQRLTPFISREETRYYLNGICLHSEAGLTVGVATNGHTLGKVTLAGNNDFLGDRRIILPRQALHALRPLLLASGIDPVRFNLLDGVVVSVEGKDWTFRTRLIDGAFPDYARVIPKKWTVELVGDRQAMLAAGRQLGAFANTGTMPGVAISLSKEGRTSIAGKSSEADSGILAVPFLASEPKTPFSVTVNYFYLLDVLRAADSDNITLRYSGKNDPLRIDSDAGLFVIMPMTSDIALDYELPKAAAA